ncbi:hypothetical protein COM79_11745 [Bacillus cereus]|uniref:ATP-binding cassette domain-containing protein n=1 Tax=Bacillus cereus group TaxID=86661 RepID=UPI000BEE744E|nr:MULTISPECIES: ABC transporter ATP-binding protein [Bacillus cereus group]PEB58032.1 hypothetical protein COM79_11745 [Bacillus cereus]PEB85598.1 hypothetical protein COM94_19435 [Bacillus thuringiensis]PGK95018.1 hypothetical protein CN911_19355 [Bacillus thuringiensis]
MENIIEFEHVSKTIDTKCILKDITFTLPKGKIVGLLGPNGAGKTTLLKIAAQITSDYEGCVKLNEDAMFLPDYPLIFPELTGNEYIRLLTDLFSITLTDDELNQLLLDFSLNNEVEKKISAMSLGNKKKLSLMGIVFKKPTLLLLDEFISGIDPINMKAIKDFLINYAKKGNTILISTHQLEVAQTFCNEIMVINNGEIITSNLEMKEALSQNLSLEEYFIKLITGENYE